MFDGSTGGNYTWEDRVFVGLIKLSRGKVLSRAGRLPTSKVVSPGLHGARGEQSGKRLRGILKFSGKFQGV